MVAIRLLCFVHRLNNATAQRASARSPAALRARLCHGRRAVGWLLHGRVARTCGTGACEAKLGQQVICSCLVAQATAVMA